MIWGCMALLLLRGLRGVLVRGLLVLARGLRGTGGKGRREGRMSGWTLMGEAWVVVVVIYWLFFWLGFMGLWVEVSRRQPFRLLCV